MKSLAEFINESAIIQISEAALSKADFEKHGFKYIKGLMAKLMSGEDVRLGKTGNDGHINIKDLSNDEMQLAQAFNDELQTGNYGDITVGRFNQIFSSHNLRLSNFFKGDYSGYEDGLESGNKGNAFESYFVKNYHEKFEDDIKKIYPYKTFISISQDGGLNTKRPLTFSDGAITCGKIDNDNYNIGRAVTDVTVKTDGGEIYLSLKSGSSVTFVNAGVKKLFPDGFFENDEQLPDSGKKLLDMLCIDEGKFKNVFKSYVEKEGKKKAEKEVVDIKDALVKNTLFKKFMYSVMGYGFIMVHQIKGDDVEYINLLTENDMKKYVKDINEAYIEYPKNGEAKRVDIIVKYDEIEFKINIRNKQGGLYPTHIMADYKFVK